MKFESVRLHEKQIVEQKRMKDQSLNEKRKLIEMNILEKDQLKQKLNKSRVEEQEKHEIHFAKILKKKVETNNQKFIEDSQRMRDKSLKKNVKNFIKNWC